MAPPAGRGPATGGHPLRPGRQAAVLAALLTTAALVTASCGGDSATADPKPSDQPVTSTSSPGHHRPSAPGPTRPSGPRPPTLPTGRPPAGGVELSEWLSFGPLAVRVLRYQRAGAAGSPRDRIDVVTVEECADSGAGLVRHTTWHLVDAAGRTLGTAGGKMVGGHPTEDIPRQLSAGQCMQTDLAIAVPPDSVPVAVTDGPTDTWVLAD